MLRLLDRSQESESGVALVPTSTERARNRPQKPVRFAAATQAHCR